MEWTNLHEQLADYALKEIFNNHPDSWVVNFECFFNESHLNFSGKDQLLALTRLEQQDLIDFPFDNKDICTLTPQGESVIQELSSYFGYLESLDEQRKADIIEAKKNRNLERAKNHLVWLQISKHWLCIVAFIASVGFNVYFYTDYSKLKSLIKPDNEEVQAIKADSVSESRIDLKLQTSKIK